MSRLAKTPLKLLGPSLVAFLLLACPRKARRTSTSTPLPSTAEALIAQLAADQLSYTTMALQYKATFTGERRQSFTLRIHLLKDSLVWLSASLFGMEGARGLIRPDSAFLLQRLEKTLYYTALDTLRSLLPAFNLNDVSNLLLGRWPDGLSRLKWLWEPQSGTLSTSYQQARLRATLTARPLHIASWEVALPTGTILSLTYDWSDKPIPTRTTLTLPSGESLLLQLVEFSPHAADLSFAFRIPPDYKRQPLFVK